MIKVPFAYAMRSMVEGMNSDSRHLTTIRYALDEQLSGPEKAMLDDAIMAMAKAHLSINNFLCDTPTGQKLVKEHN